MAFGYTLEGKSFYELNIKAGYSETRYIKDGKYDSLNSNEIAVDQGKEETSYDLDGDGIITEKEQDNCFSDDTRKKPIFVEMEFAVKKNLIKEIVLQIVLLNK